MENKFTELEALELSDEAIDLLVDFIKSPNYYLYWLMYLNDLLIETACEKIKRAEVNMECLHALQHIRNLLSSFPENSDEGY